MNVATLAETPAERIVQGRLEVATRGEGFIDITSAVARWLDEIAAQDGLVSAFVTHTTASLAVQENADPDVVRDLLSSLSTLAPRGPGYRHAIEGPDDMPAHIRTLLSGCAVPLAVTGGRLVLGTWQSLYLVEHRERGRMRAVALTFLGR
jgi:secondary thiamine-phosphate synthase enzyme